MDPFVLKLYVTDHTKRSVEAIENLIHLVQDELHGNCEVEIIDVKEDQKRAHQDKILATPTLVRQLPQSIAKIIGDLSDTEKVLIALDIHPQTLNGVKKLS